ncbi:hypothetical protein AOA80_07095, partial [Methanomassiliicoccales archaeon RumEn M1]
VGPAGALLLQVGLGPVSFTFFKRGSAGMDSSRPISRASSSAWLNPRLRNRFLDRGAQQIRSAPGQAAGEALGHQDGERAFQRPDPVEFIVVDGRAHQVVVGQRRPAAVGKSILRSPALPSSQGSFP